MNMKQYSLESKECHPRKAQIMSINKHVLNKDIRITAVLLTYTNNTHTQCSLQNTKHFVNTSNQRHNIKNIYDTS